MSPERFNQLVSTYAGQSVAVVGDFCLDRYLEVDPRVRERSLETGRRVIRIRGSRCQAGGAGTIVNNLVALGVGRVRVVGRTGSDGEGWELRRALGSDPRVVLDELVESRGPTMTYMKPMVCRGGSFREWFRIDIRDDEPISPEVDRALSAAVARCGAEADAIIVLDQVSDTGRGVVTPGVLDVLGAVSRARPGLPILADSRGGLARFPAVDWKMNRSEFSRTVDDAELLTAEVAILRNRAGELARRNGHRVWVTLAEQGMIVADRDGATRHHRALPLGGPIDIVGAGDAVSANLAAALATGATPVEAAEMAMAAASVVVHKVGTTGTAAPPEIAQRLVTAG